MLSEHVLSEAGAIRTGAIVIPDVSLFSPGCCRIDMLGTIVCELFHCRAGRNGASSLAESPEQNAGLANNDGLAIKLSRYTECK
jgi:hypothetical protein